jgi:hypothetical protein
VNCVACLQRHEVIFASQDKLISKHHLKTIYMKNPSAPKRITWIIGLIAGILGIIGHFTHVQILSEHNYTLLLIGFVVLAVGTTLNEV